MIERAHGLVLRVRPFTETSLIVNWLTAGSGRISTVAKGARRPKSPFRGQVDLFYEADISFARSRRSDLHTLREVALVDTHAALRNDIDRLQQACYCGALIEQATERDTPIAPVFELMRGLLGALAQGPARPQTIFAFELKLLRELGLQPSLEKSRLTPGVKQITKMLLENNWSTLARLKLSASQAAELRQFLHGFLIFHLGKIPAGRAAALPGTRPAQVGPQI